MARSVAGQAGAERLTGETDLARLLRTIAPVLAPERYAYSMVPDGRTPPARAFALVHEDEGITAIAPAPDGNWARITLTVHSSLSAVGLTAAVTAALTDVGISANVIAGMVHDHLFVPWARRDDALAALFALSG
jgi:uncharacterized protein